MLAYATHKLIPILLICLLLGMFMVAFGKANPPDVTSSLDAPMLSMMQSLANRDGTSVEAAAYKYGWQNDMALMVDRIREAFPNSVTEAEVTGERSGRIDFAGDLPSSAQSEISAFQTLHPGVQVETRTNRGYSELDLDNALEAIHYALLERDEVENAITSFDSGTIRSRVLLSGEPESPNSTLGDLRELADEKLVEDKANMTDSISVVVEEMESADELGGDENSSAHLGGEVVTGGGFLCTSGFSVKNSSGEKGLATAAHCDDILNDDGQSISVRAQHKGSYGDVQWHTATQTVYDDFYQGNDSQTEASSADVSGIANPVKEQELCRNGATTHQKCDTVRKLSVCKGSVCKLVQMKGHNSSGGDSGGPYFVGGTAYGIHTGYQTDWLPPWRKRSVFTRATYFDEAIGVYVATN